MLIFKIFSKIINLYFLTLYPDSQQSNKHTAYTVLSQSFFLKLLFLYSFLLLMGLERQGEGLHWRT